MLLFKENIDHEMTPVLFLCTAGNKSFSEFYILVVLFGFAFTKMQILSSVTTKESSEEKRFYMNAEGWLGYTK